VNLLDSLPAVEVALSRPGFQYSTLFCACQVLFSGFFFRFRTVSDTIYPVFFAAAGRICRFPLAPEFASELLGFTGDFLSLPHLVAFVKHFFLRPFGFPVLFDLLRPASLPFSAARLF
jgi:hypothetical protein